MTFEISDFNGKIVEVVHGDYPDDGSFLVYRGNGDIVTPSDRMPIWAEGAMMVHFGEHDHFWSNALPPEQAGVLMAATRIDIRNLTVLVMAPDQEAIDEDGTPEMMEQEPDITFRNALASELLDVDLTAHDASDAVPYPAGWDNIVAERSLDTSFLDQPGNDEETLAEAEADGFGSLNETTTEERKTASNS